MVVAHTNTLRGLIKHIDGIDGEIRHVITLFMIVYIGSPHFYHSCKKSKEKNIGEVSMPGGIPFVYKVSKHDHWFRLQLSVRVRSVDHYR